MKICLLAALCALSAFGQEPVQQFATLGDFKLVNGGVIRDFRIGYRTLGTLNAGRSNAILFPTWFTGKSIDLVNSVQHDKLIDTSRYFVIFVDAIGDGVS
jgi:homoserine O-acetyltransferase